MKTTADLVIACVFRESKTFSPDYLKVFSSFFTKHHPYNKQIVITDYSGKRIPKKMEKIPLSLEKQCFSLPMNHWFSKLELFSPDLDIPLFYSDLDNIHVAPLNEFFEYHQAHPETPFMIDDVDRKQKRLQSAVMYIPTSIKNSVWEEFSKNPEECIKNASRYGDAKIIRENKEWTTKNGIKTYQGTFGSNSVVSYRHGWNKMNKKSKEEIKIVCMHGTHEKPLMQKFKEVPLVRDHFRGYLLS